MALRRKLLFLLVLLGFLVVSAIAVELSIVVRNRATVKTYKLYAWRDAGATVPLTEIDWGTVYNGETKTFTAYLTVQSDKPAVLSMWTDNWSPSSIKTYISLSWDCENAIINPGEVKQVIFTLTVAEDIPDTFNSFSFDIHLVAEV